MNFPLKTSPTSGPFCNLNFRTKTNGIKTTKQSEAKIKFKWTVNDEDGSVIRTSSFDSTPTSPMEDFIDEQCLHFEENFVKLGNYEANFLDNFDQLNEKFSKKLLEFDNHYENESFFSSETVIDTEKRICKKCGHDILTL